MTSIALAIPHCPWDPHRLKSLARIRTALDIRSDRDECPHTTNLAIIVGAGPERNWVWSERMFTWMAQQTSDYVMQVQDDILPVPQFWKVIQAMLAGIGPTAEIISLFTLAPKAPLLARERANWVTTTDWLTGPTWLCKTEVMQEFVEFRRSRLREDWQENIKYNSLNEDTLLGLFAAATGRRIYNPLPALVDHDTSIPSNYGNEKGIYNRASLSWKDWVHADKSGHSIVDLLDPDFWIPRNPAQGSRDRVLHLGLAYSFTPWNFLRWVKDDGGLYGGLPWGKRGDQIRTDVVQLEVR